MANCPVSELVEETDNESGIITIADVIFHPANVERNVGTVGSVGWKRHGRKWIHSIRDILLPKTQLGGEVYYFSVITISRG
jgi:hypothetical protein